MFYTNKDVCILTFSVNLSRPNEQELHVVQMPDNQLATY